MDLHIKRLNKPEETSEISWFAGLAMQAIIERTGVPETTSSRDEIALWSFRMAEAMLTVRKRLGN